MSDTLHIICAFESPHRGSERAAIAAASLLSGLRPVRLWSTVPPHPDLHPIAAAQGVAIEAIRPFSGALPRGGDLLVWGTHFLLGVWLTAAHARRVAILNELFHPAALYRAMLDVRAAGLPEPRVVHVSMLLAHAAVVEGEALYPPSDLRAFLSIERASRATPVVGRVSRDVPEKHHRDDPRVYAALAEAGVRVRILGGSCLSARMPASPCIELLPQGAVPVPEFLESLDIFFYRTAGSGEFVEPSGVAIAEAMAAALPLVVVPPGGFTDLVEDGVSGVIAPDGDAALTALQRLAGAPEERSRLGGAARERVRAYFGAGYAKRLHTALFGAGQGR